MALTANASLTFVSYMVTDAGIEMHFVCANPGPGEASDYRVTISDAEVAGVTNGAQFAALVDGKLQRKFRALNIASKLDQFIGQSRTI